MPLLYSVDGVPTPYFVPPISPAGAAFEAVLSGEMNRAGMAAVEATELRRKVRVTPRRYGAQAAGQVRKPVLAAEQAMSSPVECIEEAMPIEEVWDLMQKRRFRHLPVVSADRKLIGILSDRDVLRAGPASRRPAVDVMSRQVLTATAETPIRQIAEALLVNRIDSLPIVDGEQRVVGIVTTTDILKAVVQRAPLELWA